MFQLPTKTELKELKEINNPGNLTIYLPFNESNDLNNHNYIEFKNLLARSLIALKSAGVKQRTIKKSLKHALLLLDDEDFWNTHKGSLVFFMNANIFAYYLLPHADFPSIVSVANTFNLVPLLYILKQNKEYYVLALSHKKISLYKGDLYSLKNIVIKDLPLNMKSALNIDEYPNWRGMHPVAPASAGKNSASYHSQYNVRQTDKIMLKQYFRIIDKKIRNTLAKQNIPLILASTQYLQPIYKKVNKYPYLLPKSIMGNIEKENLENIRIKALKLLPNTIINSYKNTSKYNV